MTAHTELGKGEISPSPSPPPGMKPWYWQNYPHPQVSPVFVLQFAFSIIHGSGRAVFATLPFLPLFQNCVLYWMQTEEQKRGRSGNEATGKNSNWPIHGSRHDESVFAQLLSGVVKDVSVVCFRVLPPGDQPLLPQGEDYLQHVGFSCITLPAVNTIGKSLRRTTRSYDETTRN